jgi:hypothetical protein
LNCPTKETQEDNKRQNRQQAISQLHLHFLLTLYKDGQSYFAICSNHRHEEQGRYAASTPGASVSDPTFLSAELIDESVRFRPHTFIMKKQTLTARKPRSALAA